MGSLGPGLVTVTRDPSLVGLDTGPIRTAAGAYASAAQKVVEVSDRIRTASSSLVGTTAWLGAGGLGFSLSADSAADAARTASGALGPIFTALTALATHLDLALSQAKQAETLADQVNAATNQLNAAHDRRVSEVLATQVRAPVMVGPIDMIMATMPTPAEAAAAAQLTDQANQARKTMDGANAQARVAWQGAAAAFDAATAQAPSVQAAVAKARADAEAKYKSDHEGNALMGGLAVGGMVLLPIASGVADFFSGGTASVGTPEELAAEGAMGAEVEASFGSIDEAALASAGDAAATDATVDGVTLDSQVANDVTEAAGASEAGPGEWVANTRGRGVDYQAQVSGRAPNPDGTIPEYRVNGVDFDGYHNGTLLEAKGPGYDTFLDSSGNFKDWYQGADEMVKQATRQVAAAGKSPIEWHIAEPRVAVAVQRLLEENGFPQIKVMYTPGG